MSQIIAIPLLVLFSSSWFLEINGVPLNVVNLEALVHHQTEGIPQLRADYGFYSADNQSAFKGDNYILPMNSNSIITRSGCKYKGDTYAPGDKVKTPESCLACHCKGSVIVCKLRVCPEVPIPPPPGCILVQKANKCCSQLVCHDNHIRKLSREHRLSESNGNGTESEVLPFLSTPQALEEGSYCVHEGTVYAEGSAMRASTLCEHCFCIHGKMKCSSPMCLMPMEGCKPRYRSHACCPTNYDCAQSNQTAILRTTPSSIQIPKFLKGCRVGGRHIAEGEPVMPMQLAPELGKGEGLNRCQTCFCMGGLVKCRPLACDRPIEGCRPVIQPGHCCPDRYECEKPEETTTVTPVINEEDEISETESGVEEATPTTTPTPETTSTQVYEIRFERIPQRKVFSAVVSGVKGNSREQRRNNQHSGDKFMGRTFSGDDHEEDDASMISSENDASSTGVALDDSSGTTISSSPDTENPAILLVTEGNNGKLISDTTLVDVELITMTEGTGAAGGGGDSDSEEPEVIVPLTLTNDLKLEPLQVPKQETATTKKKISPTTTPTPTTTSASPEPPTTTVIPPEEGFQSSSLGKLEFISFGMEDAVASPLSNSSSSGNPPYPPSPTYDIVGRKGSLIPPSPQDMLGNSVPPSSSRKRNDGTPNNINVTKKGDQLLQHFVFSEHDKQIPNTMDVPVQTSLYNNGFYGREDGGGNYNGSEMQVVEIFTQADIRSTEPPTTSTSVTPIIDETLSKRNLNIPFGATSTRDDDFIPSFIPVVSSGGKDDDNSPPTRIYSKFGIHDSHSPPVHRYGYPVHDHDQARKDEKKRKDSAASFAPSSPFNFNYRDPPIIPFDRKVPSLSDTEFSNRLPLIPYDDHQFGVGGGGDDETVDSSVSYEEEEDSEEQGPPPGQEEEGQGPLLLQPLVPPTPIPRVPVISTGGTKLSLASKNEDTNNTTSSKPPTKVKIVNSKPLRKPKPPEDQFEDPLGFKPVVAFPFTLPRSQDKFSLGLKLSGCNIYGKMYSIGQIIQELSSLCVQCKCTEIGVQCSELPC